MESTLKLSAYIKDRDCSKYRHKGYKPDHVRCVCKDVPYECVVYETYDKSRKREFVYLLDEALRMDTVGKRYNNQQKRCTLAV